MVNLKAKRCICCVGSSPEGVYNAGARFYLEAGDNFMKNKEAEEVMSTNDFKHHEAHGLIEVIKIDSPVKAEKKSSKKNKKSDKADD